MTCSGGKLPAPPGFDGRFIVQVKQLDVFGRVIAQTQPFYLGDPIHYSRQQIDRFDRLQSSQHANGSRSHITYSNNGLSTTTELRFYTDFDDASDSANGSQGWQSRDAPRSATYWATSPASLMKAPHCITNTTLPDSSPATNVDGSQISTHYDDLGAKPRCTTPTKAPGHTNTTPWANYTANRCQRQHHRLLPRQPGAHR